MKEDNQSIEELIEKFRSYFVSNGRSDGIIKKFNLLGHRIKEFMAVNKIAFYGKMVETAYLKSILGKFEYFKLTIKEQNLVNSIEAFAEFQEIETKLLGLRCRKLKIVSVIVGETMTNYIQERESTLDLSKSAVTTNTLHLYRFYHFLESKNIFTIDTITQVQIIL